MHKQLLMEELDFKNWQVALLQKVLKENNINFDVTKFDYEHNKSISKLENEVQYKNWCVIMLEATLRTNNIKFDVEDSKYHNIEYDEVEYNNEKTFETYIAPKGIHIDPRDNCTVISIKDLMEEMNIA